MDPLAGTRLATIRSVPYAQRRKIVRRSVKRRRMMKTVVGLFENYMDADRAVSDLTARGFSRNEISVAVRDSAVRDRLMSATTPKEQAVGESAAAGAVGGATIGGLAGLLV